MTTAEEREEELGGDEALAAEYVLGVLPAAERTEVAGRISTEPLFAAIVDSWEAHLGALASAYPPVAPPESVKAAVDAAIRGARQPTGNERSSVWASLSFWRGLAALGFAGLAVAVVLPLMQASPPEETGRMVASLSADGSDVRYVALFDRARGSIAVSHLSGNAGEERDFELWVLEGPNATPASLGVIPAGDTAEIPVSPQTVRLIDAGALFAISREPAGGSPTGAPTGPVVAAGELRSI